MEVKTLGVFGSGAMGRGIAWLGVRANLKVVIYDSNKEALAGALATINKLAAKAAKKEEIIGDPAELVEKNLIPAADIEAYKDADFVIEAASENLDIKKNVFSSLEEVCSAETILATNTSVLSITEIAAAVKNGERVVGMHFFNPPYIMPLVEIIRGYYTSDKTVAATDALARHLGRHPVTVQKDSPGFIVNRILTAYLMEAIKLYQEGVASKEDIDSAVKLGLNHPMGPFALQDLIGLDLLETAMEYFSKELDAVRWQTPQELKILLKAGRYGVKSGAGWYDKT